MALIIIPWDFSEFQVKYSKIPLNLTKCLYVYWNRLSYNGGKADEEEKLVSKNQDSYEQDKLKWKGMK